MKSINLFLVAGILGIVLSSPTPTQPEQLAARRTLAVPSNITSESQRQSIAAGLESDGASLTENGKVLIEVLEAIVLSPAPASIPDAISSAASV
jgi:hypothetical protein